MKTKHYVGIDMAADTFTSAVLLKPGQPVKTKEAIANTNDGFSELHRWLQKQNVTPENSTVCLEATGTYGEHLCYFLVANGYQIAVEPPLKVKRAFKTKGHKNDKVDSQQIAEYAFRYPDELHYWQPRNEIVEQVKVLLVTREQFVQQKTANINALKAVRRKKVQTPFANEQLEKNIKHLAEQIKTIESEIQKLIDQDQFFRTTVANLDSITSVGLLMASNFLVATQGFETAMATEYRKATAYVGICPYAHQSGTSVHKTPTSAKYGPSILRKLLHLAARSLIVHDKNFRMYFERKVAQGKPKKLVLNNIANKLVKIMCAVVKNQKPYIKGYIAIKPSLT